MRAVELIGALLLAGGALGLLPAISAAQTDTVRWQGIPLRARVRITTPGAREIHGRLVGWTDSSLTIRTPPEVMIGLREIQRLRVARGHRLGRGLWIGASIGVAAGTILGIAAANESSSEVSPTAATVLLAGFFGIIGGGTGAIAGALTTRWSDVAVPHR